MRKFVFIVLFVTTFVLMCTFASGNTAHKEDDVYYEIHYIKNGDTLWDIACLYSQEGTDTVSYTHLDVYKRQLWDLRCRSGLFPF